MRILIVDDDAAIIAVIRDSVNWEKIGITDVRTSCTVERARHILLEEDIDIVISDIEMPIESGLDLLKWFREKQLSGKFLLLTCHENFQYATEAVKFHAEEYLLKPFNVEIMERVLQKLVQDRRKELEIREKSTYGEWFMENGRDASLAFWASLFSGRIMHTQEGIFEELKKRKFSMSLHQKFYLVVSKITNMEEDINQYGQNITVFILENLHSEILCGTPENERVVNFEHKNYYILVSVCDEIEAAKIKEKCSFLISKCGSLLTSTITCCISRLCDITEFYDVYHRQLEALSKTIIYYGEAFFENQIKSSIKENQPVLKLSLMEEYLETTDKLAFMNYLIKELDTKVKLQVLNGEIMKNVEQEIQQAVYAYLAKKGIQVSLLLSDEMSVQIAEKANQSVADMIRWVNYLLSHIFEYEEKIQKSQTIIEKINGYVQEHYKENIGRNEIGAHFYLVPEYLAKMYKKKTGKNLKDYINEYRIEQARNLLNNPQMKVSDVAEEVGFDNYSYFSTLFKKYMGMTPNEYKKSRNKFVS